MKLISHTTLIILLFLFSSLCYATEDAYVEQATFYVKGAYGVTGISLESIYGFYNMKTINVDGNNPLNLQSTLKKYSKDDNKSQKRFVHVTPFEMSFSDYSLGYLGLGGGVGVALGNLRIELEGVKIWDVSPLKLLNNAASSGSSNLPNQLLMLKDPSCLASEYSNPPPASPCPHYVFDHSGFNYQGAFVNIYGDLSYSTMDVSPFVGVGAGPVYLNFSTSSPKKINILTLGVQVMTGLIYTGFEQVRPYLGYNFLYISPRSSKDQITSIDGGYSAYIAPKYYLHRVSLGVMIPLFSM